MPDMLAEMAQDRAGQLDPECVDALQACARDLVSGDPGLAANRP
jgi:HD-GYP domain-containing protein (c-di-GMP phosphodiesterase class II)